MYMSLPHYMYIHLVTYNSTALTGEVEGSRHYRTINITEKNVASNANCRVILSVCVHFHIATGGIGEYWSIINWNDSDLW